MTRAPGLAACLLPCPRCCCSLLFYLPQVLMFAVSLGRRSAYGAVVHDVSLANYLRALEPLYLHILWRSLLLAAATTVLCLLVAYPVAWWIARQAPAKWRNLLLTLVILPFWTSFLVRMYAWIVLLRSEGVVNLGLGALGLPRAELLYNDFAVLLGQVYGELPFMIIPLYVSLEKLDPHPARGGGRPRRRALAGLPTRGRAADDAGHRGRLRARLHPLARRLPRPGPPRRRQDRLHRQPDPEPVRGGARHAVRGGALLRAVARGRAAAPASSAGRCSRPRRSKIAPWPGTGRRSARIGVPAGRRLARGLPLPLRADRRAGGAVVQPAAGCPRPGMASRSTGTRRPPPTRRSSRRSATA